jgi:phosphatidylinositol-3-phosphatase
MSSGVGDPGVRRDHWGARWRTLLAGAAALAAGVSLAFATGVAGAGREPTVSRATAPPRFAHVMVVVLENKQASAIVRNPAAPVFNGLARRYALLANYDAVAHPSLPNYLALISGTTGGLRSDCLDCYLAAPTIAQTLDTTGATWKTYVEGVRRNRFGDVDLRAVKARIPFLYSRYVLKRRADMKRIVPLAKLAPDLRSGRLPTFSLVVPNLCHDMHNCSIRTGDRWLGSFAGLVLPALGPRDVVFVVFDESHKQDVRGGGGRVAALVLGPLVRHGSVSHAPLDHYSLLRTIEAGLGLPRLGQSAQARPIAGVWRR